jgi:hypothetical protein
VIALKMSSQEKIMRLLGKATSIREKIANGKI